MEDGRVLRVKFKPGVSAKKRFEGVVRILTDLIEDGMRDEVVRQKTVQILNNAGVRGHDELGEIRAITRWVQTNMIYRKDGYGVEFFHTARRLIRDIEEGKSAGDCDDFVILGGALLGSIGYPVGALIVDSNNDGIMNHVMLVTKTFSPTREFGDSWIPIELIYPQFKIGESVPISQVYPLMANVDTARSPIMRKAISGMRGLAGFHPLGQLAGLGNVTKSTVYDMKDAEEYGNYTGSERSSFMRTSGTNSIMDPDGTYNYAYDFVKSTNYGKITGVQGRKIKVVISGYSEPGAVRELNKISSRTPVSVTLATSWRANKRFGRVVSKTPQGRKISGSRIEVELSSPSDYVDVQRSQIRVKLGSDVYMSSQYDTGYKRLANIHVHIQENTALSGPSLSAVPQVRESTYTDSGLAGYYGVL